MNELTEYQQRRLNLADKLRAVRHIARRYDDAEREREARQLLTRLASGRFGLAVAGQFSRGKTTLMNSLLGDAWLPMGALPMGAVIPPSGAEAGPARWSAHVTPAFPSRYR